ncbi:Transposase, Mutator family [Jiangella alkaliphila]|uniref:Mutator family transposase n=1 Tax=Jiangella alkaliphila TaxID=419479 RepID=A0A1H2L3D5_9ACTN|nr:Transposase, Mutator family [Jiangella alkaliphila]
MTDHLGYEPGDPAGRGSGNSRNGRSAKTVATTAGPVNVTVPRDRNSTFAPQIVPKHSRRVGAIEDIILSLYARGLSTREIEAHLKEIYDINTSPALISKITDVVVDEITLWQNRPVDEVYPIVYVDAIRIRVRDRGSVTLKSAHLVVGVDVDGLKDVLGIWIAAEEGAKFWAHVLTQLRNRGLRDVLILCCDGLTGLPDAARSVFDKVTVQTCVVHVIRNTMRFISYGDRKKVATAMRHIYTGRVESFV